MQSSVFGKKPVTNFSQSPNYKSGAFQNISPTEVMLKSASFLKLIKGFINKPKSATPAKVLPSVKSDLRSTSSEKPVITWFGHSSYLIQYDNKNILVDPVFSGNASPSSLFVKAFPGADVYTVHDMPQLDLLIITHDHYDHLDFKTVKKLINKAKHVLTPLGVGSHLQHWGFAEEKITELDWGQHTVIDHTIKLTATPARHFSGRGMKRNQTLWSSFVLEFNKYKIYIGSDSGYDTHFKTIGEQYGPFDLAILETGQYNELWPHIHMFPEQAITATKELKARILLPVHWGKFALAYHPWNEPIQRVTKAAKENNVFITTPMIGEQVILDTSYPQNVWWNN